MSISKKIMLISLIATGSFYADSEKSEKPKIEKVSKSSITFMQQFLKKEGASISLGLLNIAGIYKFFGKEFAALATSAVALCVVRMYLDEKAKFDKENNDKSKKSE